MDNYIEKDLYYDPNDYFAAQYPGLPPWSGFGPGFGFNPFFGFGPFGFGPFGFGFFFVPRRRRRRF